MSYATLYGTGWYEHVRISPQKETHARNEHPPYGMKTSQQAHILPRNHPLGGSIKETEGSVYDFFACHD
jgi:hypothetical protein